MIRRPWDFFLRVILFGLLLVKPALSFGRTMEGVDTLPRRALLSNLDENGDARAVNSVAEWQIKRRQILDSMQAVMGQLPDRSSLPPMNVQYTDSIRTSHYIRYSIKFTVAENEILPAYLYLPLRADATQKLPAMLALHPTGKSGKDIVDGRSDLPNRAYAKELAERGYVVIAPDYPSFGDLSDYDFKADRYVSATMKGIFDNMRCVDLLQARDDVDPDRIGVIGHSLGGHNAMFVAAFDTRLRVVISSCGWTLMHYYFNGDTAAAVKNGGKLWPWAQERYMPLVRTKYRLDIARIPFDFDEVIAAIAPRAFFSNSPLFDANFNLEGVKEGMANASKVYAFLGVAHSLKRYSPPSKHDFPPEVRGAAYHFIDSIFQFTPGKATPYSYLDNPSYLSRLGQFDLPKGNIRMVMLGNSLTQRGDWKKLFGSSDVVNQGIGSDITLGFIHRIDYVFRLKPEVCIIEGGANDLVHHVSKEDIIQNLAVLIDTLRHEGITPILNTVTLATKEYRYLDPNIFNREINDLNEAIKSLAKEKKVPLIDLNPIVSDGIFRIKKYAVKDGIHYTTEAYLLWKEEILKKLRKLNSVQL